VTAGASRPIEVHRSSVQYPGGLAARYRWAGTGGGPQVFSLSETGGDIADHGRVVSEEPDRLCRAELRVEGPLGAWTARFASVIFDEPRGLYWDTAGLLVVKYGFHAYGLEGRHGSLAWTFRSGTPILALLGSSRLPHVLAQSEIETTAVRADGDVAWRVTHSDVVIAADLVGGRLILESYDGQRLALDPLTGAEQT
jgi:hypothetical protein